MAKKRLICAKSLFASEENQEEDQEDKEDKEDHAYERAFARKRNQFLIHLFAKLDSKVEDALEDLTSLILGRLPRAQLVTDRHVTLVNGFFCLRFHEISAFVHELQTLALTSFSLCLHRFRVFRAPNRCFLVMAHSQPEPSLAPIQALLEHFSHSKVDSAFQVDDHEFRLHVSLASLPLDDWSVAEELAEELSAGLERALVFRIGCVEARVGHMSRRVLLS